MLTPQDIQNQEFAKAVFGGYDMTAVDDFLEQLTADYAALYKDNMVLKGKLKVLVEKVEEYRSTEDAMRMALLTAQKMSDDMMAETKQKCDEMLSAAARDSDESRAKVMEDISHEDMKLEAAKVKTSAFVQASRQIIDQYRSFLDKLDTVTAEFGGAAEAPVPQPREEHEPVFSPEPERPRTSEDVPAAEPEAVPEPAPENVDPDAGTKRIDLEAVRRIYSGAGDTKRIWDEDEEDGATPRPKFDFSDLQFGTNYAEDPGKKKK